MPKTVAGPYCLTVGDPTGIGPEIVAKLLQHHQKLALPPLRVIGNLSHLEETAERLGIPINHQQPHVDFIHIPGQIEKEPGAIAYMALEKAVELIQNNLAQGMITGPISKHNLHQAGIGFSGHTEILQHLAQKYYKVEDAQADMLFLYQSFRLLLLTRHVPLRHVSQSLSLENVSRSLENLVVFFKDHLSLQTPRLCLLGVNPHAGEIGGEEERNILIPAMEALGRRWNLPASPPLPADGVFRGFRLDQNPYDAYIAAYHDQGLIPFKMVAGLKAVNVTIGLPFLRTSVSHGTAHDIVGHGIADPVSLIEAVKMMARLTPSLPFASPFCLR